MSQTRSWPSLLNLLDASYPLLVVSFTGLRFLLFSLCPFTSLINFFTVSLYSLLGKLVVKGHKRIFILIYLFVVSFCFLLNQVDFLISVLFCPDCGFLTI